MKEGQGILTVLSGFSGAGKGTVTRMILEQYDNYALSISATTRAPREGEENGREYFFKTVEEFEKMIAKDDLIEYAKYVNNYYGTPKEYVQQQLQDGKDVILEIEIQGALKVKEKYPDALLLFITPPSAQELKNRLIGRGTEKMDVIEKRMETAAWEAQFMDQYDYIVINDKLQDCVEELHAIIQSEHRKSSRNLAFAEKIKEQLEKEMKD